MSRELKKIAEGKINGRINNNDLLNWSDISDERVVEVKRVLEDIANEALVNKGLSKIKIGTLRVKGNLVDDSIFVCETGKYAIFIENGCWTIYE